MNKFDYIIVGAGCSGLSLAYEMNARKLFINKTCLRLPVVYQTILCESVGDKFF